MAVNGEPRRFGQPARPSTGGKPDRVGAIAIVGCGPGSPEYLTEAARRAVATATFLAGSPRLLALFGDHPGRRVLVDARIDALLAALAEALEAEERIAVLVGGDPGLCSLAEPVLRRFGRGRCRVIPGVSSVQVAFSRLDLPWTDARIVSAHGRTPPQTADELAGADKVAILGGTREAAQWAAAIADRLSSSHAAYLWENLTLPDERGGEVSPDELRRGPVAALSIVLLVRKSLT
jgi:precorrin-6y C5,15-methyltransferase (decarboxylating) CbiE subunit